MDTDFYYKNGEMGLILKGKTTRATEGHNISVGLPPTLIEAIMSEEGPMQVELINSATGDIYSFYKDFHKVKDLDIDIPSEIMQNFQAGQDVVVKMRRLPAWEFANSIEGDASGIVRFNKQGVLIADFGGKEIPIQSLDYDYGEGQSIGGATYIEFQVRDVLGATARRFRLYDSGLSEPRLAIYRGGKFRPINNIEYYPELDFVEIEYRHSFDRNYKIVLFFEESSGEIDFGTGRVTESRRIRVEKGNTYVKGEVGEEIAAKIVEEKLEATVFKKNEHEIFGPDREIVIDGEPGILEAKLATSKEGLKRGFVEAVGDVYRRFGQSDKYKKGIAFSTYIDEDTGHFEYIYKVVNRETQNKALDQLPLTTYWMGKVGEQGVDVGNKNQPMYQTLAGFSVNQKMSSDTQYGYQQMYGTRQDRQQQVDDAICDTKAQSTISSTMNKQDTVGVGSKQYNIVHSQSKDRQQRSSSQSSVAPAQREQQENKSDDVSRVTPDTKSNSLTNSQYKDREWTSSSSKSAEPLAKHGGQEQGSRTKDDGSKAQSTSSNMSASKAQDTGVGSKQWSLTHSQSKDQQRSAQFSEAPAQKEQRTNKSDNGSKASSGGKDKSTNKSQEQVKKNNDEPKTSGNESKGKDSNSRNYAPSARKGPQPI